MENLLLDSKMRKSRSKKWQVLSVLHILLIISLSFSTIVKAEVVQSTHNIRVSGTIGSTVEETKEANKHQTLVADLSAITKQNLPETGTVVNQRIVFLGYLLIGISGGVVLFSRKRNYPIEYLK
ncbi:MULTISPECIES: LPXTG cell wall anchor domain-containing protein [Enterococcus]|uniref:LPXTG cell wall anchor domain-containing protein n=1 Tax=Enterococcus TaxID=1350 RepID=UPI0007EEC2A2|nr:LPXTG cell wall anchor domain-containing protein [Enterococcus mundtii]OBS62900.1 hypothetical protein AX758_08875 [Enterococcus mundtii]